MSWAEATLTLPLAKLEPTTEAWPVDAGVSAGAPGVRPVTPARRLRLPPDVTVTALLVTRSPLRCKECHSYSHFEHSQQSTTFSPMLF